MLRKRICLSAFSDVEATEMYGGNHCVVSKLFSRSMSARVNSVFGRTNGFSDRYTLRCFYRRKNCHENDQRSHENVGYKCDCAMTAFRFAF